MRARLGTVSLPPTSRTVPLKPGLNIIIGPVSSGKTTFLRLCRSLIGADLGSARKRTEELDRVAAITAPLTIGDTRYTLVRPMVTSPDRRVDIAREDGESWRLPAQQPTSESSKTYGHWLLEQFYLPRVEVPLAPSRADTSYAPVSINDYTMYCVLNQDEIDTSVFGHIFGPKNVKRKAIFEILYGLLDPESAALEEKARDAQLELRRLTREDQQFQSLLAETPFANRALIQRELEDAEAELARAEAEAQAISANQPRAPATTDLQASLLALKRTIAEREQQLANEENSMTHLAQLMRQLDTQSGRLTRALVADTTIIDFEFQMCPRCGAGLAEERFTVDECGLCLQVPIQRYDATSLLEEQDRVERQIKETRQLLDMHQATIRTLRHELAAKTAEHAGLAAQLESYMQRYVSEHATVIASVHERRAQVKSRIARARDYETLHQKADRLRTRQSELQAEVDRLNAKLETLNQQRSDAHQRIKLLEKKLNELLLALKPPFEGDPAARIDTDTYLPIVWGKSFDQLSHGTKVLVNIAHAIAHQLMSLEGHSNLPNILIIDGLTDNIGKEGFDKDRFNAVYGLLMQLHEDYKDRLQLIVADHEGIPREAEEFLALRLTETDKLIPPA